MNTETTKALRKEVYAGLDNKLAKKAPEKSDFRLDYMRGAYGMHTEHGVDPFLGRAPHILIASAPKTVPLGHEDCLIALTTFELLPQTMGVGTVWLGLLTWCLTDFFPELATKLGVPEDHEIGYCMAFGRPAVQYHRTVQRGPAEMNLVESFQEN